MTHVFSYTPAGEVSKAYPTNPGTDLLALPRVKKMWDEAAAELSTGGDASARGAVSLVACDASLEDDQTIPFAVASCRSSEGTTWVLGMFFEAGDNPLDYQQALEAEVPVIGAIERTAEWAKGRRAEHVEQAVLSTIYLALRRHGNDLVARKQLVDPRPQPFYKMFVFGLDAAGKSTFVTYLRTGEYVENLLPTKRREIHTLLVDDHLTIKIWDMPGQEVLRKSWTRGMEGSDILVFVLDAADSEKFQVAKAELWKVLNRYEVEGIPLAFLANKCDLLPSRRNLTDESFSDAPTNPVGTQSGSDACQDVTREGLVEAFDLEAVTNREWQLFFTSLVTKEGVEAAVNWILERVVPEFPAQ